MPCMNRWRHEWLMSSYFGVRGKKVDLHEDYDGREGTRLTHRSAD